MLTARSVFAANVEATAGTAESLDATHAVYDVYDLQANQAIQKTRRPSQLSFEPLGSVSQGYVGQFSFKTDVVWDGTATLPAMFDVLLPACGFAKTGSTFYSITAPPGSTGVKTATMHAYIDGTLRKLVGAMGDWVWYLPTGRPSYIEWTFTGIWQPVTDTGLLNPTTPTAKAVRFNTTNACTYNAVSIAETEQFVVASGNTIAMAYSTNTASGYKHAIVAARVSTIRGNPESCLVATQDRYLMCQNNDQAALAIEFLGNGTSKIGFSAPKAGIETITSAPRDGLACDDILWACNKNASNENQALAIAFTASA
jgi:hypothetical protein